MSLTILGNTVREPVDRLEVFPAPDNISTVRFYTTEFTSMCPVTMQPDLSTLTIEYAPDKVCVESKSLKLYLWSFRDKGVFCEALATTIAERVLADTNPRWVKVTVEQQARGGIVTTATSELHKVKS